VVGRRLLVSIHEALCIAKGNDMPFGGINIIFAGDFAQLPPVGQRSLYSRTRSRRVSNPGVQADLFGRLLWLSVGVVVLLTHIVRQSGSENAAFVDLLGRLRDDQWLNAPFIVPSNDVKDALNERAVESYARQTGRKLQWYDSID
ncbi:hypothetical protein EV363DRAFT_1140523, partial [Boletus edulis]